MKYKCYTNILLAILPMLVVVSSCEMTERAVQLADEGYLMFRGNLTGLKLQVDDAPQVDIQDSKKDVRYTLESGRHRIRVYRAGLTIVDRQVLVTTGQGIEVVVQ
jgi:hypothetical protein